MYNPNSNYALKQYHSVDVTSSVTDATPHRLIQMLLENSLARVLAAKGCMKRGEIGKRGENIGLAISIIGGLQNSLDLHNGGQIAENLNALYEYMGQRLFDANRNTDLGAIDEVIKLLTEIKSGWDAIPEDVINANVETLHKPANNQSGG